VHVKTTDSFHRLVAFIDADFPFGFFGEEYTVEEAKTDFLNYFSIFALDKSYVL
jgi:hypothetical protein